MGGIIASHLARKGFVEFLFADRTFYDLQEVSNLYDNILGSYLLNGEMGKIWNEIFHTLDKS
jgi:hypothetical protein